MELYALALAVGLAGGALVHGNKHPQDPPLALLYVAVVLLAFPAVDRVLQAGEGVLLPVTALLVAVGLVTTYRLQPHLVAYQAAWVCGGLALSVAAFRLACRPLNPERLATPLAALLVTVSLFPWGWAWLASGLVIRAPVEPVVAEVASELAKLLALALGVAELPRGKVRGYVAAAWAAAAALWLVRGDAGTAAVMIWVVLALGYCATASLKPVVPAAGGFLVMVGLAYATVPELADRLRGWVNPWADRLGVGYPLVQSLFALAAGGLIGAGPGAGYPELVPQSHAGFVLAAVAEEWGFAGVTALVAAYAVWTGRAVRAAGQAKVSWVRLLAAGAAALVASQAFLAAAGAAALVPPADVTMPFVSAGGLSTAVHLALAGAVLAAPRAREELRWGTG
ncbi:MAG: FtsW/RodA/SpoVE family cell cycle protein [bacterium]